MSLSEQRQAIGRARVARTAADDLATFLERDVGAEPDVKLVLADTSGERVVVIPRAAVGLLVEVLEALGEGREPSVVPMAKELSTGEVASLLGVSRQYAVRLLDDGRLPFRRVGNRRRVQLRDALRYLREDNRRRAERLREVAETTFS